MTWWMILLIVLVVLWLILQIRFGGRVRYSPDQTCVVLLVGPFRIQVFPKNKEQTEQRTKRPKKTKTKVRNDEQNSGKPGTLLRLMQLLPVAAEAAGALKRKIRIEDLFLSVVWGGENDAAAAAIGYGRAHAAIGIIWPLFEHNFKVRKSEFCVDVDYEAAEPVVTAELKVTLSIGQILSFGVHYGLKAMINWTRSGKAARNDGSV